MSAKLVWDDPNPSIGQTYIVYRQEGATWTKLAETAERNWPIALSPGQHVLAVSVVTADKLESALSEPKGFLLALAPINLRLEV